MRLISTVKECTTQEGTKFRKVIIQDISGKYPRIMLEHPLVESLPDTHEVNTALMREVRKAYEVYAKEVIMRLNKKVARPYPRKIELNWEKGVRICYVPYTLDAPEAKAIFEKRLYNAVRITHQKAIMVPRPKK